MNEVQVAHKIYQLGEDHATLKRLFDSEATYKTYRLIQSAIRRYRDMACPQGRFDWDSTEQLAQEAIRRGAMQKPGELKSMLDVAADMRPKNLLEIGTAHGGTYFALAHTAMDSANLISVDKPGGSFGGGYKPRGKKRIQTYGLPTQNLELLQADSHDPDTLERVVDSLRDEPLDFLMIDGDHSYEGVKQDWEMYSPLVGEGGVIALHDVAEHEADPRCQVSQLWQEIKQARSTQEFIDPVADGGKQWGGVGIVFN
jgi:cephalosporin hydroxylase